MKRLFVIMIAGLAVACNSGGTDPKAPAKDEGKAPEYAYKIDHPDNWEIGSSANTATALSALKAWEKGDIDACIGYFGDSTVMQFDAFDKKLPKDSVKAMLGASRSAYKNVEVKMHDWESVIAKDKSIEWVTLWYTQYTENKAGAKDSISCVNDIQVKNGKIVHLTEYFRKFH